MLKSMNFLSGKSRGRVGGGGGLSPLAPVILCLVHRILFQQGFNLVNKFALLLNKCWFTQDSWDKPKNDGCRGRGVSVFSQSGRSMIEMLGVLAIIAVLSVGGIAGYSKAMEMFKINKIIEEYNYFIAGLLEHLPDYEKLNKDSSQLYLTEFAIAANLTPTTWKNYDNWTIIDSQNHMVWPFVRGGHLVFEIGIVDQSSGNILPHSTNLDYCRALYRNVMQPLHGAVSWVTFYRHQTDNSSYVYYGDGYCGNENKCLSELSLSAIDEMCKSCTDKNPWCHIVMTF